MRINHPGSLKCSEISFRCTSTAASEKSKQHVSNIRNITQIKQRTFDSTRVNAKMNNSISYCPAQHHFTCRMALLVPHQQRSGDLQNANHRTCNTKQRTKRIIVRKPKPKRRNLLFLYGETADRGTRKNSGPSGTMDLGTNRGNLRS